VRARRRRPKTPLRALVQGLVAGAVGTAALTAYQGLTQDGDSETPRSWSQTSDPAQVGHRVVEGVFRRAVPLEKAGVMTNVVHWMYGTGWGRSTACSRSRCAGRSSAGSG
jgi:hypothetical protein